MSITTAIMYSGQITHNSEACIGFFSVGSFQNPLLYTYYGCFQKLGVTPQIIHFNMVFHFLSPSIFGGPVSLCFPSFWENIHMGRGWRGLSSPTWQTGLSQRHHRGLGNLMTSIVGCWSQMKCRIKLPTDDFWMFLFWWKNTGCQGHFFQSSRFFVEDDLRSSQRYQHIGMYNTLNDITTSWS